VSAFSDLDSTAPIDIWNGVIARTVDGENCSFGVVDLEADSVVPEHQHANEQLGIVVSGSVRFRVGDEERELGPGGTWRIPPNVPHEVTTGPEGAIVLDVFSPPREDWAALERSQPRSARWPG